MSANTSPSHYTEDAFVTDANFKVEINQKMKVPDKISFNTDLNGDKRNSWIGDNLNMNVPERILVAGQHQHVGMCKLCLPIKILICHNFIKIFT